MGLFNRIDGVHPAHDSGCDHLFASLLGASRFGITSYCQPFFPFLAVDDTGMVTKQWAAIHRKHHAKVETDEDPHSPVAKGIKKVFFEGCRALS